MLTNPSTSVDWKDDWSIERLHIQEVDSTQAPSLDLFHYMVLIAGTTEVVYLQIEQLGVCG